jgi:hypothetical protein
MQKKEKTLTIEYAEGAEIFKIFSKNKQTKILAPKSTVRRGCSQGEKYL